MDLQLKEKLFVVTGATSGFGKAIASSLLKEGANVIINARGAEKLDAFKKEYPKQLETIAGDITTDAVITKLIRIINNRPLSGIVINAGGPPAKSFIKTVISDWDNAYESLLRWKVKLTQQIIPLLKSEPYGRILYIESSSVKQPIENLVLSNSLRLAVVGFVKSLSQELGDSGITCNVIAPGYHATPAMDRLFIKRSETEGISSEDAKDAFEKEILVGQMGDPEDLASLACWILSPYSRYITGQTITVDGGLVKSTFS